MKNDKVSFLEEVSASRSMPSCRPAVLPSCCPAVLPPWCSGVLASCCPTVLLLCSLGFLPPAALPPRSLRAKCRVWWSKNAIKTLAQQKGKKDRRRFPCSGHCEKRHCCAQGCGNDAFLAFRAEPSVFIVKMCQLRALRLRKPG